MSANTLSVNTTEIGEFSPLYIVLMSFPLTQQSEDNELLQRLKILCKMTTNSVHFKILDDNHYLVYTDYNINKHDFDVFNEEGIRYKFTFNTVFPTRSLLLSCVNNELKVMNYSIKHVYDVHSQIFCDNMFQSGCLAQTSYEGTTVVGYKLNDEWKLRTTSCNNAFESFFDSESSYGLQFEELCVRNFKKSWQQMLNELEVIYPNSYFVFVVVHKDTQHVCDNSHFENNSEIILINCRTNYTHKEHNITVQPLFMTPTMVSLNDVQKTLTEEKIFDYNLVKTQGFVMIDPNGYLIRVTTNAYYYANQMIPHFPHAFNNVLYCYMNNSFDNYCKMKQIPEDIHHALLRDCHTIVLSVSNLAAYMYTLFTKLDVKRGSFMKVNGELYNTLQPSSYMKMLPMLQKHSISRYGLQDFRNLSQFVSNFIKSLHKHNFELFLELIKDYDNVVSNLLANKLNDPFINIKEDQFKEVVKKYFNSN